MDSTNFYNFRLSRCKYANLIDQSDVKWWADIQAKRLAAGEHNSKASLSETKSDCEMKQEKQQNFETPLSYLPLICPIQNCEISFLPNDLIMHFLSYHSDMSPLQRIFENQHSVITIFPFEINVDEIICIGLVSYGGKNKEIKKSEIGKNLLWIEQNLSLHEKYKKLSYDYPIFILASIVHMDIFISKRQENNICPKMLVIWLAGGPCNVKIYYTLTAFNGYSSYSRSAINCVRSLSDSQDPCDFCSKDHNYFRLTFKELNSLIVNEKLLKLELCLQEF